MRRKFVKYGLFWGVTRILIVPIIFLLEIGALNKGHESLMIFIIFFFAFYMFVLIVAPMSIIGKTAARIVKYPDFYVDYQTCDGGCYLMIDTHRGKIACVFATNPFALQIIDASNITDVKTFAGNGIPAERKTANRLGVHFWVGKQKCTINTYISGRSFITLKSDAGQKKVLEAGIIQAKLQMAKEVAQRHSKIEKSESTIEDILTKEQISQVNDAISKGDKLTAVKIIQMATHLGLSQSMEIVDNWEFYYQSGYYRR